MNYALTKAKNIIAKRKNDAEYKAELTKSQLLEIPQYCAIDDEIRNQILQVAKSTGTPEEKEQRERLESLREKAEKIAAFYGYNKEKLAPQYTCKICSDSGFVKGEKCICLKKELRIILFGKGDIHKDAVFEKSDDGINKEIYAKAKEWCAAYPSVTRHNILIEGKTGSGKTYLSHCIASALAEKGVPMLFLGAYDLNQKFLFLHLASFEDKSVLSESLFDIPLLIIDDLGTEPVLKNVTEEYLFSLLNYRKNKGLDTVISSNLLLTQIKERYSERTLARMADKNNTLFFSLKGEDRRLSK